MITRLGLRKAMQSLVMLDLPLISNLLGRIKGDQIGLTFTRDSDQWCQDDTGVWFKVTAGIPAFNSKGIFLEPVSTNKCTCYGAIPADIYGATRIEGFTLIRGVLYEIVASVTLDFTTVGAISNLAGTQFVAADAAVLGAGDSIRDVLFGVGIKSYYSAGAWRQNHANMTINGNQAAILLTVEDEDELIAAGLSQLGISGKVYKLDNSAGSAIAYVTISGITANTNAHTMSVFARSNIGGVGTKLMNDYGTVSVMFSGGTGYNRYVVQNFTPGGGADKLSVYAKIGDVVYFVLPQLEELPFVTSPMPTVNQISTRAAIGLSFATAGNCKNSNFTVYFEAVPQAPTVGARQTVFTNSAGGDSGNDRFAIRLRDASTAQLEVVFGSGADVQTIDCGALVGNTAYKVAVAVSSIGVKVFINGALAGSSAAVPAIVLGAVSNISSTAPPVCYLRNLRTYRKALDDEVLAGITT